MARQQTLESKNTKAGQCDDRSAYTDTALRAWKLVITQLDQMFSSMNDEELRREVAPGRNRVFYLMGHLTAVHDRLLPMLSLGERLHPELDDDFVTNADRVTADRVAPEAVRSGMVGGQCAVDRGHGRVAARRVAEETRRGLR